MGELHGVATSPSVMLGWADEAVRSGRFQEALEMYGAILDADEFSEAAQAGMEYVGYLQSNRTSRYDWTRQELGGDSLAVRQHNAELNQEEFHHQRIRLDSRPRLLFIEHTRRCNFYCLHCTKGYAPYRADDIDGEVLDRLLDSLLPTAERIDITGFAEPTISPHYRTLVQRIAESGLAPGLTTNASTITAAHIEGWIRTGAQVVFSIDGASKATFETIRAGGDWKRTVRGLALLQRIRTIRGDQGAVFSISFVAMRSNIHELPDMVRLVRRFDLYFLKVQHYSRVGVPYDDQAIDLEPERANRYFEEAEQLAKELGVTLLLPPRFDVPTHTAETAPVPATRERWFPDKHRFPRRCEFPWSMVQVHVDGAVSPCCTSTRSLGNIHKKSFLKIWNGWRYRLFRWRMSTPLPPPECRTCHVFEGVNAGNPANPIAREGWIVRKLYGLERRLSAWFAKREQEAEAPNYYKGKSLRS